MRRKLRGRAVAKVAKTFGRYAATAETLGEFRYADGGVVGGSGARAAQYFNTQFAITRRFALRVVCG